ncbi:MAG: iron-sulfur cluster assembly accessory protein [Planctomycetaceae bacterium]|jgi:iron-sulfur cluster assembly protein|nr:iron-sulfur cluster assembly accessory protein [Planctomycetaceae bacterium]
MPITMTPAAVEEVKFIKTSNQLDDRTFLRVSILGGGCSGMQYALNFDTEFDSAADTSYEFDGVKLATMKKFDPHFDGTQIDFIDDASGRGFAIDNPNFPKSAGCAGCGH